MFNVSEGIVCFRANNPSPMTLDGTNCYVLSWERSALLVDVGPEEGAHLDAMAGYLHSRQLHLRAILLTHTHSDHLAGLDAFRGRVPAPVYAFKAGYDRQLRERQIVEQLNSGPKSVDELVQAMYAAVDPRLHGAAAWSVRAHLKRLQQAGRIAEQSNAQPVTWSLASQTTSS